MLITQTTQILKRLNADTSRKLCVNKPDFFIFIFLDKLAIGKGFLDPTPMSYDFVNDSVKNNDVRT